MGNSNSTCKIDLFTSHIDNVTELRLVFGFASQGLGLWTKVVNWFCNLLGTENDHLTQKMCMAHDNAVSRMIHDAQAIDADGIMDIRYEITNHTTVIAYGTAFKRITTGNDVHS